MIPGGHTGGVHIETRRFAGHLRASAHRQLGPFDGIEHDANVTGYQHDEIEDVIEGAVAYGARFEQTTTNGLLTAHRDHSLGALVAHAGALGIEVTVSNGM